MTARPIAALVLASSGCWVTYSAGTSGAASSGGDAEHGGDADTDATTDASTGACEVPAPDPSCDGFADPLRAFELACAPDVSAATFESPDAAAWRRAHEFGNAFFAPRFGDALLVMSTGLLPEVGTAGQLALEPGVAQPGNANANPDDAALPQPMVTARGSNGGAGGAPFFDCDGIGDCSDTLGDAWATGGAAFDLLWWSAAVVVPSSAQSFALSLAWLSAEFPERIGAPPNDAFVLWISGESFTGNIATVHGELLDTTTLAGLLAAHALDDPMLLRTGFDGGTGSPCEIDGVTSPSCPRGAATDWLTLRAPVRAGEQVTIAAALFDRGDDRLDSVVLLDHFRWSCEPCTPGVDCGVTGS